MELKYKISYRTYRTVRYVPLPCEMKRQRVDRGHEVKQKLGRSDQGSRAIEEAQGDATPQRSGSANIAPGDDESSSDDDDA